MTSEFIISYRGESEDPDRTLFRSVLAQAFQDIMVQPENYKSPKRRSGMSKIKREAEAWFEAKVGVTAEDFEEICARAGFNPELIRAAYYRLKAGKVDPDSLLHNLFNPPQPITDEDGKVIDHV